MKKMQWMLAVILLYGSSMTIHARTVSNTTFPTATVAINQTDNVDKEKLGVINGQVIDQDGKPVVGAIVKLDGTDTQVTTDKKGFFAFKKVPVGSSITVYYVNTNKVRTKISGTIGNVKVTLKPIEEAAPGELNISTEKKKK